MFMEDKGYGLTKAPNEGVKDKAPDWMNEVFEKMTKSDERKKQHPFSGIDDPILNPDKIGLKKDK